jgi:tRNA (uracil-5-)-methyltransferase
MIAPRYVIDSIPSLIYSLLYLVYFLYTGDQIRSDPALSFYAMFDPANKGQALEIKCFPRGSVRINTLMTELHKLFFEFKNLFSNAFEVRFLTTLKDDEACIVICYKKPLSAGWQAEAEEVSKRLNAKIIGRARKMKQVAGGGEEITEELTIKGRQLKYLQTEGAFSQPNGKVCEKMITWAMDCTDNVLSKETDLLELYCGGGTFTAALASNFRKVLATELSKASVALANATFKLNAIENIQIGEE